MYVEGILYWQHCLSQIYFICRTIAFFGTTPTFERETLIEINDPLRLDHKTLLYSLKSSLSFEAGIIWFNYVGAGIVDFSGMEH